MTRNTKSSDLSKRTTRKAVANLVKGNNLIFHVGDIVVKGPISVKEFLKVYLRMHQSWGNIEKLPKDTELTKLPYKIDLGDGYSLYVAVITYTQSQCPTCGIWKEDGKSDYCPQCNGKVVEDSIVIDL